MALFELTLILLLVAILMLQVSRRFTIPYPTILALAGVVVAALPWAPDIAIDPHLALALFIAPALLDAAYDLPPRALRRNWLPVIMLAGVAVLLTTAAVAWAGVALAGLPLAAAIALGAIVAPPDAAAASAMLSHFELPRRTVTVLKGESLLNDAVALLIFSGAVSAATASESFGSLAPQLLIAAPGGLILGILFGKLYLRLSAGLAGTLGGTLFEFVATFGAWIIAERLHLSAVLCVVAYAMTIARYIPERQSPRDRVHSYAVWEATVFLVNVLAFLLMGLQARAILTRLERSDLWDALAFAGIVLAIVILVRLAWVMLYNRAINLIFARINRKGAPSIAQSLVVSWCGMRGLVTLATALALPPGFPARDTIVLAALAVVLGTLILQGLTIGPLIRFLAFKRDDSFDREMAAARVALIDAALSDLGGRDDEAARGLRAVYVADHAATVGGLNPRHVSETDRLRRRSIAAKRKTLAEMRRSGQIEDDVFHALEMELDWAELASSPPERFEIVEG
ncbi:MULTISPECIES: cation:proton antiporter [Rhodomicrobium]|uniref:cation:proton antiporter n=1 Tax=Rhodomicrobium TaxID=1068 RepID=UPI000B4B5AAB|nr:MULTISPECIES: cation:proton antiporter [Rhodomicrobium]